MTQAELTTKATRKLQAAIQSTQPMAVGSYAMRDLEPSFHNRNDLILSVTLALDSGLFGVACTDWKYGNHPANDGSYPIDLGFDDGIRMVVAVTVRSVILLT